MCFSSELRTKKKMAHSFPRKSSPFLKKADDWTKIVVLFTGTWSDWNKHSRNSIDFAIHLIARNDIAQGLRWTYHFLLKYYLFLRRCRLDKYESFQGRVRKFCTFSSGFWYSPCYFFIVFLTFTWFILFHFNASQLQNVAGILFCCWVVIFFAEYFFK